MGRLCRPSGARLVQPKTTQRFRAGLNCAAPPGLGFSFDGASVGPGSLNAAHEVFHAYGAGGVNGDQCADADGAVVLRE